MIILVMLPEPGANKLSPHVKWVIAFEVVPDDVAFAAERDDLGGDIREILSAYR